MRGAVQHRISVRFGIYPWPPAWPGKIMCAVLLKQNWWFGFNAARAFLSHVINALKIDKENK